MNRRAGLMLAAAALLVVLAVLIAVTPEIERIWLSWSGSIPDGDPAHGKTIAAASCAACHGTDGNSADPQNPKLAGQTPAYLYRQLRAFASGARSSEVMASVAKTLSDQDMADVAVFYGEQTVRPDEVGDEGLASMGRRIFFDGAGGVPACARCHGSSASGAAPMMTGGMGMMGLGPVPRLGGQHAAYTRTQLDRFAQGERTSHVMTPIAAALSPSERQAVAAYLAGVP